MPACFLKTGRQIKDHTHDSMPRGKSWLMAIVALKFFLLSLQTSSLPKWGALRGEKQQPTWECNLMMNVYSLQIFSMCVIIRNLMYNLLPAIIRVFLLNRNWTGFLASKEKKQIWKAKYSFSHWNSNFWISIKLNTWI